MVCRYLILEFNENTSIASCFHKKHFVLIRIKLENYESPKPGQFLIYDENEAEEENGVIKPRNVRIEDAKGDDCISLNEDGTIRISSWIAFSSDKRHRTFDRKLAFADWYGLVDSSEIMDSTPKHDDHKTHNAFKTFIVVKDLDYERNQTQLFKIDQIKGKLGKAPKEKEDYNKLMERMKDFEENLLDTQSLEPCALIPHRPSRSIDGNRNENSSKTINEKKKNRSRSRKGNRQSAFVTGPPINVLQVLQQKNITETPILPSQPFMENRNIPQTSSTYQPSLFPEPTPFIFKDSALVINQNTENEYVVWLEEKKDFAVLDTSRVGLVLFGFSYECQYAPVQSNSSYSYEIIKKYRKLERIPFNINIDREVNAEIYVDLCSPNTKCQVWSFYTGVPFFNSPQVGVVTMADYVDSPQGRNKSWQEVLRTYLGDSRATNMYCICRVVKQRVPEKLFNPFLVDEFKSAERYTWQVIKIRAAKEFVQGFEEEIKRENLREDLDEFEEEDDVARQKRENRKNVRFESSLFSSGPSSSFANFSYPQSPFQPIQDRI